MCQVFGSAALTNFNARKNLLETFWKKCLSILIEIPSKSCFEIDLKWRLEVMFTSLEVATKLLLANQTCSVWTFNNVVVEVESPPEI